MKTKFSMKLRRIASSLDKKAFYDGKVDESMVRRNLMSVYNILHKYKSNKPAVLVKQEDLDSIRNYVGNILDTL